MNRASAEHTANLLRQAARANSRALDWILAGCGGCTHLDTSHSGPRSLCNHHTGPTMERCPCTGYRHLDEPDEAS